MKKTAFLLALVLLLTVVLSACADQTLAYDYDLSRYIELGPYEGIVASFEKNEEMTREELDEVIYQLRLSYADFVTEKEIAEKYDRVTLDVTVKLDGVEVSEAAQKDMPLILGLLSIGSMETALQEPMLGKKAGDIVTTDCTLAEDSSVYGDLAGKTVHLVATVKAVHSATLPEITEDFILMASQAEFSTLEELELAIVTETQTYRWQEKQEAVKLAFMDSCRVLQYPEKEINEYKSGYRTEVETQASLYGLTYDQYVTSYMGMTFAQVEEQYNVRAREQVKQDMVMRYLPQVKGTVLSEEEYQSMLAAYFEADGESLGLVSAEEYEKKFGREMLTLSFLWDKCFMEMVESAVPAEK